MVMSAVLDFVVATVGGITCIGSLGEGVETADYAS